MKYYFSRVAIAIGSSYSHHKTDVHSVSQTVRPSRHRDQYMRTLLSEDGGGHPHPQRKTTWTYVEDAGSVHAKVIEWRKISKEHYDVLKQYL